MRWDAIMEVISWSGHSGLRAEHAGLLGMAATKAED